MKRLTTLLGFACVLLVSAAAAPAGTYSFTNIIDSTVAAPTGNYLNIGDAAISGNRVAFKAGYDQGYLGILDSIFTSTGGPRTAIVHELANSPTLDGGTFSSFGRPAIDGNTVYFGSRVFLSESFRYGDGIFYGTGVHVTTPVCYYLGCYNLSSPVVSAAVPPTFVAGSLFKSVTDPLASAGQLAFRGSTISETIPNAIYTLKDGGTKIVGLGDTIPSGDRLSSIDANYGFSAGNVAFRGGYRDQEGIFTGTGGALSTIAKKGDPVPSGGTLVTLLDPAISGSKVAFLGTFSDGSGIFTGDGGPLLTIVRTGDATPGGDTFSSFSVPSIGGATVAFRGSHSGVEGIYSKTGAVLRTVVEIGDPFFGSTVASLNFSDLGLDPGGSGNLAFTYGLADGRTGVAMAIPGPALPSIFQDANGTIPVPDSVGIVWLPAPDFSGRNLTKAYLAGADLKNANAHNTNLTNAYMRSADLSDANLSGGNLSGAVLEAAHLTGANLSGTKVTGANFDRIFDTTTPVCSSAGCTNFFTVGYGGITPAQLYGTTTYQAHDLTGIHLEGNDLTNADLRGQNLTRADFKYAKLTDANLSGAEIRGANFGRYWFSTIVTICANAKNCLLTTGVVGTGISPDQLYSTKSYLAHDLTGVNFGGNVLTNGNFAGQNLTNANFAGGINGSPAADLTNADLRNAVLHNANFRGATLTNANLSEADARGSSITDAVLTDAIRTNFIQGDGHVNGLDLAAAQMLRVRDYDGDPAHGVTPLPITIDQHFAMGDGGALRMMLEADAWDSTISFAAGIPVTRGGTLMLDFAPGVDMASQRGRTFRLFDWTGVAPTGTFHIESPNLWNLDTLYTTGEVTLAGVPIVPGFPAGAVSFADQVVDYSPVVQSGGPTAANSDPSKALGVPDYVSGGACADVTSCRFVSLGDGGSITLRFLDNVLTGSDSTDLDLRIFEVGPQVEDTFVEISNNGSEWFAVGKIFGSIMGIDIDAFGFGSSSRFSYVRLTDDGAEGGQTGASVGADIDAVGAISTRLVPEPSSIVLAAVCVLGLIVRPTRRNSVRQTNARADCIV